MIDGVSRASCRLEPVFHTDAIRGLQQWINTLEKLMGKISQCQTHPRQGHLIRGITAEEGFIYEIMQLCLIMTLTSFDDLLKIRGIQGTKEKTTSELSKLWQAHRAANRHSR
jgi:hypothetical protein